MDEIKVSVRLSNAIEAGMARRGLLDADKVRTTRIITIRAKHKPKFRVVPAS